MASRSPNAVLTYPRHPPLLYSDTPEHQRWAKAALEELKELSIPALDEIRQQEAMETITAAVERYNLKLGLMDKWMVEIMAKLNLMHSELEHQSDHSTTRPVPQLVHTSIPWCLCVIMQRWNSSTESMWTRSCQ